MTKCFPSLFPQKNSLKLVLSNRKVMMADSNTFSSFSKKKIVDPETIGIKAAAIKAGHQTIATLNGSFDLLHAGHLHIIYEASKAADVLIMALNTDASIKGYKGPLRPLIPLEYRMQMIAALEFVDYVTWFNEADPRQILSKIQPDVHVNGAEYGANCIEAETVKSYGGEVLIVNLLPGLSTSQIITKIKSTCA